MGELPLPTVHRVEQKASHETALQQINAVFSSEHLSAHVVLITSQCCDMLALYPIPQQENTTGLDYKPEYNRN